jgi:hypothetical protein
MANEIPTGGTQTGGGHGKSDQQNPGGSSGTGGYGEGQNQANHQGQDNPYGGAQSGYGSGQDLDRGAAYDAQQGGGRSSDDIDGDQSADDERDAEQTAQADAFLQDQQAHQDRGQSSFEERGPVLISRSVARGRREPRPRVSFRFRYGALEDWMAKDKARKGDAASGNADAAGSDQSGQSAAAERIPAALREFGEKAVELANNPIARSMIAAGLVTAAAALTATRKTVMRCARWRRTPPTRPRTRPRTPGGSVRLS